MDQGLLCYDNGPCPAREATHGNIGMISDFLQHRAIAGLSTSERKKLCSLFKFSWQSIKSVGGFLKRFEVNCHALVK